MTEVDRQHWSFRPLQEVKPPQVQDEGWVRTPIDRFILHGQEAGGLKPNPRADTRILFRRAYFDLIGLPPQWAGDGGRLKEERLGLEVDEIL